MKGQNIASQSYVTIGCTRFCVALNTNAAIFNYMDPGSTTWLTTSTSKIKQNIRVKNFIG